VHRLQALTTVWVANVDAAWGGAARAEAGCGAGQSRILQPQQSSNELQVFGSTGRCRPPQVLQATLALLDTAATQTHDGHS
jgi:hypothetical protein